MKLLSGLVAVSLAVMTGAAGAQDYKVGALEIEHPWSRATPKGASVAAGYLTIRNTGTTPDRLVGGEAAVAKRLEIHEMSVDGGVMKMRELKSGLEIKPGETVELKPGSLHLMLVGLNQPVEQGKPFKGKLVFEKAGAIEVEFAAEAIGGQPGGHAGHGK